MRIALAFLIVGLLAACGVGDRQDESDTTSIAVPDGSFGDDADPPLDPVENVVQPPPQRDAAPGTARAAADVARGYLEQVSSGDSVGALIAWDGDAAAAEAAARRFAGLGPFAVDVGEPGPISAGSGQRHVTVPFRASGSGDDARSLRGRITLHRTGDVDDASFDQRRWRIRSVDFGEAAPQAATLPPDATTADYACDDGSRIAAAFDNVTGTVTLRRGGERVGVLEQQRSGSGIWYRGGGAELRGKGNAATITLPGETSVECQAR